MKGYYMVALCLATVLSARAQTLEKMQWFNEPENYAINGNTITIDVPANTDYWRQTHYGIVVDDAPFLYGLYGGEFETKVQVYGEYNVCYDHAGMMLRIDNENWVKAGLEQVDGRYNISVVVTHGTSDWSVIPLEKPVESIWIKAVRNLDAIEIFYSFDDKEYVRIRECWMKDRTPMMVGMMAASPDGNGYRVKFENFTVKHIHDQRRKKWSESKE